MILTRLLALGSKPIDLFAIVLNIVIVIVVARGILGQPKVVGSGS